MKSTLWVTERRRCKDGDLVDSGNVQIVSGKFADEDVIPAWNHDLTGRRRSNHPGMGKADRRYNAGEGKRR